MPLAATKVPYVVVRKARFGSPVWFTRVAALQVLAGLPQPEAADGRLVLAADVSNWVRPDVPTSADRRVYGRSGRSSDQFIPGWPFSFVAALESGRTSWCQFLDAVRLGPEDEVTEVTATQLRRVVTDLIEMDRWHFGDRDILIVFDVGYDAPRMAHLLSASRSRCWAGCAPTTSCDGRRPRSAGEVLQRGLRGFDASGIEDLAQEGRSP